MPENEETQVVEGRVTQRKVYLKKWKPTISYQFKKKRKNEGIVEYMWNERRWANELNKGGSVRVGKRMG